MSNLLRRLHLLALTLAMTATAHAWGAKGHEISARAAVNVLPKDFPAFFLSAKERLVYLCNEPDRWKGGQSSPALGALNPPDHYFDVEVWGAEKIPGTRYDLLFTAFKRGIVTDAKGVAGLGTAPVVIAELAERLITNFRQWRETRESTEAERTVRRQVEENIIYTAGVMAHFVTDLANPLHCTVHHNGWAEGYPNPNQFPVTRAARGLHARFESQYVDKSIDEKDLPALIPASHRTGPWVAEMETFIRRNNAMVEKLYLLDRAAAFSAGKESAEAHTFTLQRLADGAGMLRDVWNSAWLNSREEWLSEAVLVYGSSGKTLLELLRERNHVEIKNYPQGQMVTAIGNRGNGLDERYWMYYVNGKHGAESVDKYVPRDNERVEWRFEGGAKP